MADEPKTEESNQYWGGILNVTVPLNFYDYLKRRCGGIFPYVEKEVAALKEENAIGPFSDLAEFAIYSTDYFREETLAYIKHRLAIPIERFGEQKVMEMLPEFLGREPKVKRDIEHAAYALELNYVSAVNFEFFDKKTFYIMPNLYEHLAQTSIDMDCSLARLPFLSCLFVYDSSQAIDLLYQIDGDAATSYSGAVSVFISEIVSEGERNLLLYIVHADMNNVYCGIKRQLLLREGWTLEQALRTDWLKINNEKVSTGAFSIEDEKFYTSGLNFFRSIINTILYLGSNDADLVEQLSPHPAMEERLTRTKSRDKRKYIKGEMKKISHTNYIVVGHDTPKLLPGNEHDFQQKRRELNIRFIVRGHWRNQVCGPENSLRRLVWIKPHYKGPEISQVIKNRPYVVT